MADKKKVPTNPNKFSLISLKKDIFDPMVEAAKNDAKIRFKDWPESCVNRTLSKLERDKVKYLDSSVIKLTGFIIERLLEDFGSLDKSVPKIYGAKSEEEKISAAINYLRNSKDYTSNSIEAVYIFITKMMPTAEDSPFVQYLPDQKGSISKKLNEIVSKKGSTSKITAVQFSMIEFIIKALVKSLVFLAVNWCGTDERKLSINHKLVLALMTTFEVDIGFITILKEYMAIKKPAPKKKSKEVETAEEGNEEDEPENIDEDSTADEDD